MDDTTEPDSLIRTPSRAQSHEPVNRSNHIDLITNRIEQNAIIINRNRRNSKNEKRECMNMT